MKTAICDDDVNAINYLKAKIELQGNRDNVEQFMGASEMTPEKMCDFDLIYLDIEMPGMGGMEIANLLRASQEDARISPYGSLPLMVFVSGYKEYMAQAFSVQAFDFLIKQVSDALEARELIKLRVLESAPESAREAADAVAEAVGADVVQVIGSKFILYRQSGDKDNRKIVLVK